MGTSGSYGGSNKKAWKDARQQILDLPSGPGAGGGAEQAPSDEEVDNALDDLWQQIGDALDSDDPTLHAPDADAPTLAIPDLLPWLRPRPGSGGGGGGAGGGGVERTGGGRQGSGSTRQVTRSAARGGVVLGAAHALRTGDSVFLDEVGLDLDRLRSLSPLLQCAEILDAVLGEESHPDEAALRKASLESLKEVLASDDPADDVSSMKTFVVNFVFELSLVELQAQLNSKAISPADVADQERRIRTYLERRVETIALPTSGTLRPSQFQSQTEKLTKEAIKILRARSGEDS